jgi:outer membrane scaffolding protein for murein synthesis (MipA/OmpV family)
VLPIPLVDLTYDNRYFVSTLRGAGLNLVALRSFQLGAAVNASFGRSEDLDSRLRGMGDIAAGADARLFARWQSGLFGLSAEGHRLVGGSNGALATAAAQIILPLHRRIFCTLNGSITWADGNYMSAYFGVLPSQASAARAPFDARAGLRDTNFQLTGAYQIDRHWFVQTIAGGAILLADAAASPLTEKRIQPMVGGFIGYGL